MTPGPIDLKAIADRLGLVDACLRDLRKLPDESPDVFASDWRNAAAAESLRRRATETLFDALRHLLARSQGLGALEYEQVARLAREHGLVADATLADRLLEIAGFRNRITHFYDEVTPEELFRIRQTHLGDLAGLAVEIRAAATRLAAGA
jgi:uncharacterized protein YutE (UPF0331/DUF86 family)